VEAHGDGVPRRSGPKEAYALKPRELPSGHWKGRVVVYDPDTGRRREITRTFPTKTAARQWAEREAVQYRDDPLRRRPTEETVGAYLARWLDIKGTTGLAAKTLASYRQMAQHVVNALGPRPLKAVTPFDVQQFYARLAQDLHLSVRTVRYVHTVFKMACADAVTWGLLAKNPAAQAKVRAPRASDALRVPTPQEMTQLLAATQGSRWFPLWAWLVFTGTRLGEALALQWGDIDWAQGTATVQRAISGEGAARVIKEPKTPRGRRTISLGPTLLAILREWQAHQARWRDAAGGRWEPGDWVFTTTTGRLLGQRHVVRAFKQALVRAQLPGDIRVHDLRHAMATQWLSAGINPRVVSERLGHSNVGFTLQVYGHVLPHDEARAAARMEQDVWATGRRWAAEMSKTHATVHDATGQAGDANGVVTPVSPTSRDASGPSKPLADDPSSAGRGFEACHAHHPSRQAPQAIAGFLRASRRRRRVGSCARFTAMLRPGGG
jgi:integrase